MSRERLCGKNFTNREGCCGECKLMIMGNYAVWEVVSSYCKGRAIDRVFLDCVFDGEIEKTEVSRVYKLKDWEKWIVTNCDWKKSPRKEIYHNGY